MIVEVKGKEEIVPGCMSGGTFLDAPGGLRPWCTKEECRRRSNCVAAEGGARAVGEYWGERTPGTGVGRPRI